jgi:hypothetical protein
VLLAFMPSTSKAGTYGFSLEGTSAAATAFGKPITAAASPAAGAATEGTFVSSMAAAAIAISSAPAEQHFLAPAGRKKSGFVPVDAVKVAEGARVIFYAEEANPMVLEIAQGVVDYFDRVVFPEETVLFGPIPDTDKNGKVILLATNAVNTFSNDPGQFTGGFFASKDLTTNEGTNRADMLYLYLPKPMEQGGVYDHAEEYRVLMNEVIVHELQHMISFAAHRDHGGGLESAWLNEGLSHWAEDHFGYRRSNTIRARKFLESPGTTPLVGGAETLAERGAAFLFVKFLVDTSGDPLILRKLVGTGLVSTANVEHALGRSFGSVLRDWSENLYSLYPGKLQIKTLVADLSAGKPAANGNSRIEAHAPQSAPTFIRVRGPGVLNLKAAPSGAFQGMGKLISAGGELAKAE